MLIFLADGRLGNQIFQYLFLKKIQKNEEKIIVSDLDDLLNVFEIKDDSLLHIPKKINGYEDFFINLSNLFF